MEQTAFQDQIPDNFCFGCGPANQQGLRIKSFWEGSDESICTYQPEPYHTAGPRRFLNGGIIATLIDCHCICTAIARAYQVEGRELGSSPLIWYATGSLTVNYQHPTPLNAPVVLRAHIVEVGDKKTVLTCSLSSQGRVCAEGKVVAVRVPFSWREPQ
jgi:acyl-coenzyme A thioesterase PaaI-like protein